MVTAVVGRCVSLKVGGNGVPLSFPFQTNGENHPPAVVWGHADDVSCICMPACMQMQKLYTGMDTKKHIYMLLPSALVARSFLTIMPVTSRSYRLYFSLVEFCASTGSIGSARGRLLHIRNYLSVHTHLLAQRDNAAQLGDDGRKNDWPLHCAVTGVLPRVVTNRSWSLASHLEPRAQATLL